MPIVGIDKIIPIVIVDNLTAFRRYGVVHYGNVVSHLSYLAVNLFHPWAVSVRAGWVFIGSDRVIQGVYRSRNVLNLGSYARFLLVSNIHTLTRAQSVRQRQIGLDVVERVSLLG